MDYETINEQAVLNGGSCGPGCSCASCGGSDGGDTDPMPGYPSYF